MEKNTQKNKDSLVNNTPQETKTVPVEQVIQKNNEITTEIPPKKNKKVIITVGVIIGIIILIIVGIGYFGVLNPSRFMSSGSGYSSESSLNIQVKHGEFANAESSLRQAVSEYGAIMYRESINEYQGSKNGYYTLDVLNNAADGLIAKLKTIGRVESFRQSKGTYSNSYGSDGLKPGYTRITVSIDEKDSVFSSLNNLEASDLGTTFSGSIVALFYFAIAVLPWVAAIIGIYFLVRYIRKQINGP